MKNANHTDRNNQIDHTNQTPMKSAKQTDQTPMKSAKQTDQTPMFAASIEQSEPHYRGTEVYASTEEELRDRATTVALDWTRQHPGGQVDVAYFRFMPSVTGRATPWHCFGQEVHVVLPATKL